LRTRERGVLVRLGESQAEGGEGHRERGEQGGGGSHQKSTSLGVPDSVRDVVELVLPLRSAAPADGRHRISPAAAGAVASAPVSPPYRVWTPTA
jgi:hypothetical protein